MPPVEKLRVLLANEPHIYREAISEGLMECRPRIETGVVEPEDLDLAVENLRPHLVLSSRVCDGLGDFPLMWVVLYPEGQNRAEITVAGGRSVREGVRLGDLISLVDEAERLRVKVS